MKKSIVVLGILALCGLGIFAIGRMKMEKKRVLAEQPIWEESFLSNPSDLDNIGDPFVLRVGDTYYCYPTSSASGYKVYRSKDLSEWEEVGQAYLYYSRDCSENVVGEPVLLSKPEQEWELQSGDYLWNEGPYVLKNQDTYYLMYSSNYYASREYSIGYATSKHPLGPYEKYEHNPILATRSDWKEISGPGHHSITTSLDGKELWMVYHTHTVAQIGGGNRQLNVDRMGFREDGSLFVNGPSLAKQLLPSGIGKLKNIADSATIECINQDEKSDQGEGKELFYLVDKDASPHSQTNALLIEENQILKLTWPKEQQIVGVRLLGDFEESVDGTKIYLESKEQSYHDGFNTDSKVGGAMEAYFEAIQDNELTIFFEEGCSSFNLKEIEILSASFPSSSEDESTD